MQCPQIVQDIVAE